MNTHSLRLGTTLAALLSARLVAWPQVAIAEGTPSQSTSNQTQQDDSNEMKDVEVPFDQRVKRITWDGEALDVSYRGIADVVEKVVGELIAWPTGLAYHPDGRIGFSEGQGSTRNMRIAYWSPNGNIEPVVNIQYAGVETGNRNRDRSELERKGYFWFFAGPMGFDAEGTCCFSLGSCGPNGIYKIVSQIPVGIEKLHAVDPTFSLQIPPFDKQHLYSTSGSGIYVYAMTPSVAASRPSPWFSITGKGILMNHSLVLSPSRLLVTVVMMKFSAKGKSQERGYYLKTLLFDKQWNAYWSLPKDDFGPMALSWDEKQMIHYDRESRTISEFSLVLPAEQSASPVRASRVTGASPEWHFHKPQLMNQ